MYVTAIDPPLEPPLELANQVDFEVNFPEGYDYDVACRNITATAQDHGYRVKIWELHNGTFAVTTYSSPIPVRSLRQQLARLFDQDVQQAAPPTTP